jgi:hypothetical protein
MSVELVLQQRASGRDTPEVSTFSLQIVCVGVIVLLQLVPILYHDCGTSLFLCLSSSILFVFPQNRSRSLLSAVHLSLPR